jgi:alkylation response protein AidB-like acyl-CoA dehydrogenase
MSLLELDTGLNETQLAIQDTAHKFAAEVMRPVGEELDKLAPEKVIEKNSILWDVHKKYRELGLNQIEGLDADMPISEAARIRCLVGEELGWGDSGLAISLMVAGFPATMAALAGNESLQEQFADAIGCWAITEPDHGSDMIDFVGKLQSAGEVNHKKPNCVARKQGNGFVISGQKAAWVSNGTIADSAALFCAVDMGDGVVGNGVFVVELTEDSVSRGKPLDKIGQRALNQGEIFFDGLKVPAENLIVPPENYGAAADMVLCLANGGMGTTFLGLARAALEIAIDYAQDRIQGGVPIFEHQSVKSRLFEMFRKVECARALNRSVIAYNMAQEVPALHYAISSKVTSTQTAFEVTSEALQILGGAGVSKEYPIEKMFRDARISMIEDGCNHVLGITAADRLRN